MKHLHHVFEFTRLVPYPNDSLPTVVLRALTGQTDNELDALINGCQELVNACREAQANNDDDS